MKSRRLTHRFLTSLLVLTLAAPPAGAIDLPDMGDSSGSIISPEQERQLGEAFMRSVRAHLTVLDDPEASAYLQALGNRLVSQSSDPGLNFTFFLVKDEAINAFAGPGGYIGINTGLLLTAESESELAAVVAHEIAHVTQRHLARTFEAASKFSLPYATALLAAILISTQSSEAGQAAMATLMAGSAQQQINFTRHNEHEADNVGMQLLADAGFDPHSMPAFFERLQRSARLYGDRPPEFLSTHPVNTTRIAESTGRAEQYPRVQHRNSPGFDLIRARLRVIAADNVKTAHNYFSAAMKQEHTPAATRYGYALASLAIGKHGEARTQLEALRKEEPDRLLYTTALADVAMAQRRYEEALALYRGALANYPDDQTLSLRYAAALLQNNAATEAMKLLQAQLRKQPNDPSLYRLLARAAGDAGQRGEAHAAQAEYYYLTGDAEAAIMQLELGQRVPGLDFYTASRIDARLQQIKEETLDEREKDRRSR